MLECVLQGVPENSNILPGLDNEKPRHCFQASSGPSTVQFLSVCKKVGKESQTGEARRSVSGPVGHLQLAAVCGNAGYLELVLDTDKGLK